MLFIKCNKLNIKLLLSILIYLFISGVLIFVIKNYLLKLQEGIVSKNKVKAECQKGINTQLCNLKLQVEVEKPAYESYKK